MTTEQLAAEVRHAFAPTAEQLPAGLIRCEGCRLPVLAHLAATHGQRECSARP